MVVVANVYPMTDGNETEVVKVENNFKNSTPVSDEFVVEQNEPRHFSEERK